ncbi:MAG: tetratricopeptide repeat protein [Xenococcaceae cyanobacterium]
MGYSVEVNSCNYNAEVIENSYEKPVLVDFFATWCGPCQLLKPMLEKLVKEYDFILAKVDIDQNQDLANHFGIEGVPDVRIVTNGKMIPGFVGVLPEPQLRELLAQLHLKSELELGLEEVHKAIASQDARRAKHLFDELFAKYPENSGLAIEAAKFLVRINQLDYAEKILETIGVDNREYYPKAQSIKTLIQFKQVAENPGVSELDQLFAKAARLTLVEDYEGALQLFLEVVQTSRKYRNDGARKAMISIFNLLGLDHALTKKYQQELMLTLY